MTRQKTLILLISGAFLLSACGPKPPPKGPGDAPPPAGTQPGGIPAGRKVSRAAKVNFADAVKAYEAAKKKGLNSANCGEVAAGFGDAYATDPKLAEARFNEGVVWEECGDLAKAEQIYQAVLQKHPNFGPALNNLGQIYYTKGEEAVAIQYFQKAVKVKTSEAYANLAVLQRNRALKGDMQALQGAIENVHRALAVDSFNIEAYGTLALALYDHAKNPSQLEMARLICAQAIKVNPKYPPIYNILGLILLRMEKVTPALAEFRKAVALDANYMEAQMNIGAVTLSFRDYDSAANAFTKVLSLKPSKKIRMQALIGLGVALRGQRKYDEAMKKYNEAKALSPNNPAIAYNQGILVQDYNFNAANPDAAIAQLSRARGFLQKYASNGKNAKKLKDVKRRIKNIDEMIPMLQEQKKMMEEMKKMQQQQPPPPAPAPAPAAAKPAPAPAGK